MSASVDRVGPEPRCNIGPDEIARRRRIAIAATVAGSAYVLLGILIDLPLVARLVLWPIASAAAVTWLQVIRRFCVRFGAMGVENFGPVGRLRAVDDRVRREDRRRAAELIAQGAAMGLVATIVFAVLPG